MKCLLFFLLMIFGTTLNGQNTFSKKIDIDTNALRNYLKDVKLVNNTLFILSAQFCDHNAEYIECGNISKFNTYGELIKNITNDSIYPLSNCNDCLDYSESRLHLSTNQRFDNYRNTFIYNYDSDINFSLLNSYHGAMTTSNTGAMGINTILGDLYMINKVANNNNLPDSVQIIKIDDLGDEIWRKYYTNENARLKINGLQGTPDGNLAFILELSGPQGPDDFFDGYHIMKIDTSGTVLDSFIVEEDNKQPNRLLVASDGSYYFGLNSHPIDKNPWYGLSGTINKLNTNLDSIEWSFAMPNNQLVDGRYFEFYDFLEASNGDIIACGTVYDNTDTELAPGVPDKNSVWNGFIIRLSSGGEMKWLHLYKNNNDLLPHKEHGRFRPSKLDKIKELPDGRLVGAGNVYLNNRQFSVIDEAETEGFHLWLLIVDENGCLEGEECEEVIIIDGKNRPKDGYLPIITSKQTWIERNTGDLTAIVPLQYTYSEDSIFQNTNFYFERIQTYEENGAGTFVEGLYREQKGKVYRKHEGNSNEEVIMDMTLLQGDTININDLIIEAVNVDTIVLNDNIARKRIEMKCIENSFNDITWYWVEGIGELTHIDYCELNTDILYYITCVLNEQGDRIYNGLNENENCWLIVDTDDEHIEEFSIFPNPVTNEITIKTEAPLEHVEIYSLDGLLIKTVYNNSIDLTHLHAGMYHLKIFMSHGVVMKSFIKI